MSDRTHLDRYQFGLLKPIHTDDALHAWIKHFIRIHIPRQSVCPHHNAPFDYIRHAYFEPTKDCVVIAPRGGGKTKLAAVATILDLLHKPPCAVRVLGGSLDQSLRMWEHIWPDIEHWAKHLLKRRASGASRRIELINGSTAAVLTQSQRAVRGLRVQKLRCDEVEMFDPQIWQAAQLVTRSRADKMGSDPILPNEISSSVPLFRAGNGRRRGRACAKRATPGQSVLAPPGIAHRGNALPLITGAIDALSTSHKPGGLMSHIIDNAKLVGTQVFRWCILDVLERCEPARDCKTCPLWEECRGIAKTQCNGFFKIDDAIAMKGRTSRETWDAEMLCIRPTTHGCVFPSFDREVHVCDLAIEAINGSERSLSIDFGFANPLVCLWIAKRSGENGDGSIYVFDEYVQEQQTLDVHIQQIEARPWNKTGRITRITCDPAGGHRSDQTAASNTQLLRKAGYQVRSRKSLIADGLELIRRALRPAHGEPRLFINPRCVKLIKAMQSFRFGKGTESPIKDGTHDHLIDALRYWFVNDVSEVVKTRTY